MDKIDKSLMSKSKQDQPGKPPAAKPLRSRWIPDDDPTLSVNVRLSRPFGTRTDTSQQRLLDWPLHMLAICPNRKDRFCFYWFA